MADHIGTTGEDVHGQSAASLEAQRDLREARQQELIDRGAATALISTLAHIKVAPGYLSEDDQQLAQRSLAFGCALMNGGTRGAQVAILDALRSHADCLKVLQTLVLTCPAMDVEPLLRVADAGALSSDDLLHPSSNLGAVVANNAVAQFEDSSKFALVLFRFIQLCCEGHFPEFQNHLRSQPLSSISINLVLDCADYLLRLTEHLHEQEILADTVSEPQSTTAKRAMFLTMDIAIQV